jgi:cell wall-associated NlpC family hydrolase
MNRDLILIEAKKWINTPFKFKGKTIKGCDCGGLVYGIVYNINSKHKFLDYFEVYGNNFLTIEQIINKNLKNLNLQKALPLAGDILLFKLDKNYFHFGILLQENQFIHACVTKNKVILSSFSKFWQNKLLLNVCIDNF